MPRRGARLVPFPDSQEAKDDLRDLALAWESLTNTGVEAARQQAERLLTVRQTIFRGHFRAAIELLRPLLSARRGAVPQE